jgi:hypothetical protein
MVAGSPRATTANRLPPRVCNKTSRWAARSARTAFPGLILRTRKACGTRTRCLASSVTLPLPSSRASQQGARRLDVRLPRPWRQATPSESFDQPNQRIQAGFGASCFKVSAEAELEARDRRTASALFAGHITESRVEAASNAGSDMCGRRRLRWRFIASRVRHEIATAKRQIAPRVCPTCRVGVPQGMSDSW